MSLNKEIHKIVVDKIDDDYFMSNDYNKGVIMGSILYNISTVLHCYLIEIYYDNNIILFDYYIEKVIGKYNYKYKYKYRYNLKSIHRKNKIEKLKLLI